MSKGNFVIASTGQIPTLMHEFEKDQLAHHTPCTFKVKGETIKTLAEVHVEFILIHPFREGNGRLTRLLSTLTAKQAGLGELGFGPLGQLRATLTRSRENAEPVAM